MKKFKLYLLALLGCIMLVGCGSGDADDDLPVPSKTEEYSSTYSVSKDGCDADYSISQFYTEILSISSTSDWLKVTANSYTSGHPTIHIVAKANTEKQERKQVVTIKVKNGILTLTVVQAPAEDEPADDPSDNDYNNTTSQNPAYSKRR